MKAEELMIGDWVICNHYQDKPFVKQFGLVDFMKGDYEYCEPIPLTQEILEKNGFKEQNNGWTLYTENYLVTMRNDISLSTLIIESWTAEYGSYRMNYIKYIHQLQHALRMCGIEKTIEL